MARLANLEQERLEFLRKNVLETFYKRVNLVKMLEPVTYLGAYEEIKADIIRAIPGAALSISTSRLRKLFYYTNPLYVSTDKMESMSFGKDFIEALESYIKLNKEPEQKPFKEDDNKVIKPKSKLMIFSRIFGVVGLTIIGLIFWKSGLNKDPYSFRDDFRSNSMNNLIERGWRVRFFDSSLFYPQDTGVLTLRSARGDYWTNPEDTLYVSNTLYRMLPKSSCFEITAKFNFRSNNEPWQQCGIIIFDKYFTKRHSIRMTYAYIGTSIRNNLTFHKGIQILKLDRGEASQKVFPWIAVNESDDYEFYFKILCNRDKYSFYIHGNYESDAFSDLCEIDFDFEPYYVALVAFNGLRISHDGPLNTASSIPARFDWIRINECKY